MVAMMMGSGILIGEGSEDQLGTRVSLDRPNDSTARTEDVADSSSGDSDDLRE